ncbi:MAG: sigma-70 family RNA polymerase sigma factor [Pirellula sp.]
MTINPETRESLILRLPSAADAQAWREFVDLYEPLIIRFAKRRGLQDADAREIAQNVLISVAKAVDRWQPNPERGKFRAWLFRIARNQVINWIKKNAPSKSANSNDANPFHELVDQSRDQEFEIELEYRREMFRLAAAQARDSFSETSWNAFWRTSVLGESIESVAGQLGLNPGAVYVARSRVTARIKTIVTQWERNDAI